MKGLIIFLGVGLSIYAIISSAILHAEKIIIEDDGLSYKRGLKNRYIRWADISEANLRSTWTTKPELVLKADNLTVNLDFHSFVNSKDLLDSILSYLGNIPIKKSCEFTEL